MGSGQVSLCTPAAGLVSCSLALFAPALELNVNQEHWKERHSGVESPTTKTPPFESIMRNEEEGESRREGGGEFREWDLHCHVDGMERALERQAASLSKRLGRRPVALQRAAQQCLSQHINNSSTLECVCIHKCVHTVTVCVCLTCLI